MFAPTIGWGVVNFSIVFAIGFVQGSVRVDLIETQLGMRCAELLENAIEIVAVFLVRSKQQNQFPCTA